MAQDFTRKQVAALEKRYDFKTAKSLGQNFVTDPAVTEGIIEAAGAGTMLEAIRKAAGRTLESVKLFDVFRSDRLGKDKKSVAYSLIFRAPDRTLTDEEITAQIDKILKVVKEQFGAELRA